MDAAGVWLEKGDLQLEREEAARAERSYETAAELARPRRGRAREREDGRVYQRALRGAASASLARGRWRKAERLLATSLEELDRSFPATHRERALTQTLIGDLCAERGRLPEAGQAYHDALTCLRRVRGRHHPDVGEVCHRLGALEYTCANYARGESFAREALRIHRKALGRNHPEVARDASSLAALLERQGKRREAKELYEQARSILERAHSEETLDLAAVLNNLAALQAPNKRSPSERLYERALAIKRRHLGAYHMDVATTLNNLAVFLKARRRYDEAEPLYRQALATFEAKLGPRHPHLLTCLGNYAELLEKMGRKARSREYRRRLTALRKGVDVLSEEGIVVTATIDPRHACYELAVRSSGIHRFGVFAEEAIPKGRKVIEYTGELIGNREAERRDYRSKEYLWVVDKHWCLDGAVGGSGAEYVNHSCDPNLQARITRRRVLYFSRRRIRRGEELSVDYCFSADTEALPCRCGAATCRGTVNELPPERAPVASRRNGKRR